MSNKKFVLFIAHGAAEHSERYAELVVYLSNVGGMVYCSDYPGHGRKVCPDGKADDTKLGVFPSDKDPLDLIIASFLQLILSEEVNILLPWYILGHSMGTVVAQYALQAIQEESPSRMATFKGLILSAPPALPSWIERFSFKPLLTAFHLTGKGQLIVKYLTNAKFDTLVRTLKKDKTLPENCWISSSLDEISDYNSDPFCGHNLEFRFWKSLLQKMEKLDSLNFHVSQVLLLGGSEDPVTDFGRAISWLADLFMKRMSSGDRVEEVRVVGGRHEIFHDFSKKKAFELLASWIQRTLS